MRFWIRLLLSLCTLALVFPAWSNPSAEKSVSAKSAVPPAREPLIFGLYPYLSTRTLIRNYQSLADDLEAQLGRPIKLVTAPDFKRFIRNVIDGEYDLILTAPHYGEILLRDYGFQTLSVHKYMIRIILVTPEKLPIEQLDELRGHSISVVDRSAMVAIKGKATLAEAGLLEGRDYRFVESVNHTSALHHTLSGKSRAALISYSTLIMSPPELQKEARIVKELDLLPGHYYMTHPRVSPETRKAVSDALSHFEQSPQGQIFAERTAHGGFRSLTPEDRRLLAPLLPSTRQEMNAVMRDR